MGAKDILLLLILSCFCFSDSLAADTLNKGEAFNTSSSLVSQNGIFTLGFQRLGTVDANSSYLGIWFNSGTSKKPFWLANRDKPIADDSGILVIDEAGNLKLKYSGGDVVELYSSQSSSANLQAVLENSGNFVLKDANSGGEQILWQSFDFPTDTFLPGMKLGTSRTSRQTWSLASWLSPYVPTSGPFTLEWDATGNQLVVKRRGVMFWTSGPLLGNEGFQQIPVIWESLDYSFRTVSNADEDYLQYSVATNMYSAADQLNFTKWAMSFDGSLTIEGQSSTRIVLPANTCDGNNTENGCERWEGPSCRSTNEEKFALRAGSFVGSARTRLDDNVSLSISDCKDICWKECDCVGIRTENANETGCRFWYGEFMPDPTGQQSARYVIIQDTEISPNDASGTRSWIWILAAVAAVLIMILLGVFLYWRRRKRREKLLNELLTSDTANDRRELESDGNKGHNLNVYSAATIMAATNSFSFENKLGQGGFGPVYKGKLPDGREIAVKRLSRSSGQGLGEFKNELILIAKLQHSNLVRLLGCCIEGEQKMLVYEYMPNKSLDSFIFDQTKRELLDWTKRFEIIEGIAQGLIYLHKHSRVRIIHRDMKASNILLDESMNPKISDFGMARIFNTNSLEENTNRIVGTYGYMSPEYAMEGIFSVKSDVFSFGVLVLEIVSGRKNHGIIQMDHPVNLVGYAWELWKEGEALELVDPKIKDSCHKEQVLRCINVGLLCVEENALDRPTMSDVITMLTSEVAQLPMPKHPAFPTARRIIDIEKSMSSKAESSSGNGISMSTMYGR